MPVRLLLLVLLFTGTVAAYAAPARPVRPLAGIGLLIVDRFPACEVPLYERPGVHRTGRLIRAALPTVLPGRTAFAVLLRKGEWFRVVYDETGREGWLRGESGWSFARWEDFLPGRTVNLLPGGKTERDEDGEPLAPEDGNLPAGTLRIRAVEGDLASGVSSRDTVNIRWRDGNGRLLILPGGGSESR